MNPATELSPARRPASAWPLPASAAPRTPLRRADGSMQDLRKGETLTIERPLAQAVLCTHGALWITYEQTPAAGAGEPEARMVVHALTDACVSVQPAASRRVR